MAKIPLNFQGNVRLLDKVILLLLLLLIGIPHGLPINLIHPTPPPPTPRGSEVLEK